MIEPLIVLHRIMHAMTAYFAANHEPADVVYLSFHDWCVLSDQLGFPAAPVDFVMGCPIRLMAEGPVSVGRLADIGKSVQEHNEDGA